MPFNACYNLLDSMEIYKMSEITVKSEIHRVAKI